VSTASLTYEFEHWRKKIRGRNDRNASEKTEKAEGKTGGAKKKKTDTKQVGKIDIEECGKRRKEEDKKTDNTAKACCRDQ
jgi:hypothetical protein